jgi:hypothetical protein
MRTLESKGKKIAFPDTMSPDEIRAVLKVMENPGTYAKLKSDSDRMSASMDKLTEVCKAMEANESSTKEFCEMIVKCMDQAQKHQAALIKALAPSPTEVTVQAPESLPVAYTFKVIRDKDGQMTSVDATPKGYR